MIPDWPECASGSRKMDIAILKTKVQYLRSLSFDLFPILQILELSKGISLDFKFSCFGIYNKNNKPLSKNKRLLFSHNKKSASSIFLQKMMLPALVIQLYCFKLSFFILVTIATKFEIKRNSFAKF